MKNLFYQPTIKGCTCADFIPFYEDGIYHLFYLLNHDLNPEFDEGISWYKVETKDFIHFENEREVIPHGDKESLDLCAFTGSVIKHNGKYYIFYTGHNIYIKKYGNQNECILRAVGNNLNDFKKDSKFILEAPLNYDKCDFRDPYVYENNGVFYMLLCVRNNEFIGDSTGETIRMKSFDLNKWEFDKVIYSPKEYQTHECPDLFKMGDYWYLIFSEYSDEFATKYRISKSPDGPWEKPLDDKFDTRAYYAAKTAFDGTNRYLFGWVPTKANNKDVENWLWGGSLAIHKIGQRKDGTLFVSEPENLDTQCQSEILKTSFEIDSPFSLLNKNLLGSIDGTYTLECDLIPSKGTYKFGVRVQHDLESDHSYGLQFDLNKDIVYLTKLPSFPPNEFNEKGLVRALGRPEKIHLKLLQSNNIYVAYINNEIAFSFRTCDYKSTGISIFTSNGKLEVENLVIKK